MSLCWYALNARPRCEAKVTAGLLRLQDRWQVEPYMPMLPARKLRGKVQPPTTLFPGYLFCQCDLEALPLSSLRQVVGLRRILDFNGTPAVVPDEAIARIRGRLQAIEEAGGLPAYPFRPGDPVQVVSGPMAGLLAVFDGPSNGSDRVRILIEFLGQANRAVVSPDILQPASHPPRRTRGRGRWLPGFHREP